MTASAELELILATNRDLLVELADRLETSARAEVVVAWRTRYQRARALVGDLERLLDGIPSYDPAEDGRP